MGEERRGKFISYEGPEGAGKSTQVEMLIKKLQVKGIEASYTREPGGTKIGELIRGVLKYNTAGEDPCAETELLLFEAARAQLVRRFIKPQLENGIWVVCDRFADSSTAYQGYGRGFGPDTVININDFAVGADNYPDLTFLLDLDVRTGFDRVRGRKNVETKIAQLDRIEQEALEFHEKVRQGYLDLAKRYPDRFKVIDGNRDPEPIHADIVKVVNERFGLNL